MEKRQPLEKAKKKTHRRSAGEMRRARREGMLRFSVFVVASLLGMGMMGGGVAGGVRVLLRDGVASRWWLGGLLFAAGHALMAWSVDFKRRPGEKGALEELNSGGKHAKLFLYGLVEILAAGAVVSGAVSAVNGLFRDGVGGPWWQGAVMAAAGAILAGEIAKWLGYLKPKKERNPGISARPRDGDKKDAKDVEEG